MSKTTAQWIADNEAARKKDEAAGNVTAAAARRLIEPRTDQERACSDDALKAIHLLKERADILGSTYVRRTKERRDHLREFADAGRRLEHAWRKINEIGFASFDGFEVDMNTVGTSVDTVLAFGRRCEEVVGAMDKPPNNMEATMKRHAVRCAHGLMVKYVGPRFSSKKGSKFCRLAELLHDGDEDTDLSSQCKAYKSALSKKVKS